MWVDHTSIPEDRSDSGFKFIFSTQSDDKEGVGGMS